MGICMTIKEWTAIENCTIDGFSESMLDNVSLLEDKDQILFFRKLIELHRLGLYRLSIKKLERIIANPKDINIGIYIIIKWICKYKTDNKSLSQNELYDICKNVYGIDDKDKLNNIWDKFKKAGLLDKCSCAATIKHLNVLAISATDFERRADGTIIYPKWGVRVIIYKDLYAIIQFEPLTKIRKGQDIPYKTFSGFIKSELSNRNYDNENKLWIVNSESYNELIRLLISHINDFTSEILFENSVYENIDYAKELFSKWEKIASEKYGGYQLYTLINKRPCAFCEGRSSKTLHRLIRMKYHWCRGRAYLECNGLVSMTDYKHYTLKDISKILNMPRDDWSYIYGYFNNFEDLIPHLYCRECNKLLEPVNKGYLAARRVYTYRCENADCTMHNSDIYINHCFEKNCGNVIDSRDSHKCGNGFVICNQCGVCCSSQQFIARAEAGLLSGRIKQLFDQDGFHLDHGIFFCPECGEELITGSHNHNGRNITYLYCKSHPHYRGVFPTRRKENSELNRILKQQ